MKYLEVGKIVNTQGLKGEVRIISFSDNPKRFETVDKVEAVMGNKTMELTVEKVWYNKNFVIVKFAEIPDINAAEKYKNAMLRIPYDQATPLNEDEYYIGDLYDIKVQTEEGEFLGEITDIIFTGANDVYVVTLTGRKDILLPAIKSCIIKVDVPNKSMTVRLPEGLI